MFDDGVVAVAGSRSLPVGGLALVGSVSRSLVASGCSLVVGCASGADSACFSSVPVQSVRVLAAFGPGGAGAAGRVSAVSQLSAFVRGGGGVSWWAGGGASVPVRRRLAARSRAVVSAASSGLVVFFSSPSSRGSALAARFAVSRGLPVVAFAVGFPPSRLPSLGAGAWSSVGGAGPWAGAWRWVPGQAALF